MHVSPGNADPKTPSDAHNATARNQNAKKNIVNASTQESHALTSAGAMAVPTNPPTPAPEALPPY
jgi:hypothetical protein